MVYIKNQKTVRPKEHIWTFHTLTTIFDFDTHFGQPHKIQAFHHFSTTQKQSKSTPKHPQTLINPTLYRNKHKINIHTNLTPNIYTNVTISKIAQNLVNSHYFMQKFHAFSPLSPKSPNPWQQKIPNLHHQKI